MEKGTIRSPAVLAALASIAGLAFAAQLVLAEEAQPAGHLERTIEDVAKRWPNVQHVPADSVARMMTEKSAVIFDVRTEQEYSVSHLEGAIRVDPAIDSAEFLKAHSEALKGKTAVFYCSVGVRSSKLAERVGQGLKKAGALATQNMRGGIFAWHQEQRPLHDAKGPIELVHPYDKTWGKAVKRQESISTDGRQ
jgi:rhodanese-related sulfurtransferase